MFDGQSMDGKQQMNQSWTPIGFACRVMALVVALALLRGVFMTDRAQDPVVCWRPRTWKRPEQLAQPSDPTVPTAITFDTLRRQIVGGWTFLAHRDASGEQEWMDLPDQDPGQLSGMFTDLRRVNRWLGGGWITSRGLDRIFSQHDSGAPVTILDVASGSVDIPKVMSRWAKRRGRPVSIIATDINPTVLTLARDSGIPENMHLVAAEALHLPFPDNAVDVAACSFFLHHLDPPEVVAALREMRRVSRGSVLINDMVRSWPSFAGAWLFSRVFTRNPISRHDAPLSARRSYSRAELVELAAAAGLEPVATFGFWGYRVALVTVPSPPLPQTAQQELFLASAASR